MNTEEALTTTVHAIEAVFAGERHPNIRSGEREPIPLLVRRLVHVRDGRVCGWCGRCETRVYRAWSGHGCRCSAAKFEHAHPEREVQLTLDHIQPWSSGGSDASTNLRTLCMECNTNRSNRVDVMGLRRVGVVAHCLTCLPCADGYEDDETTIAYCGSCGEFTRALDEDVL